MFERSIISKFFDISSLQNHAQFRIFAIETTGSLGKEFINTLKDLCKIQDNDEPTSSADFRSVISAISVCIQKIRSSLRNDIMNQFGVQGKPNYRLLDNASIPPSIMPLPTQVVVNLSPDMFYYKSLYQQRRIPIFDMMFMDIVEDMLRNI